MTLFQDDVITSGQYADTHRSRRPFEAERRLLAAMLEMALRDWQFANGAEDVPIVYENRKARRLRMRLDLEEWFGAESDAFGSFRWLCEGLGLEYVASRAAILAGKVAIKRASPVISDSAIRLRQERRAA